MYEGNLFQADGKPLADSAACGSDGLRPLCWVELVARLGAARDFRRVMEARFRAGGSSFDRSSARHLATLGESKRGINPFTLADGKAPDGIDSAGSSDMMTGDRGRE